MNYANPFQRFRVLLHVKVDGQSGWYANYHIIAHDRRDAEAIINAYTEYLHAQEISIDEWGDEDSALPFNQRSFNQISGRVIYDERPSARDEGDTGYMVQMWPFSLLSRWSQMRAMKRFNRLL